MTALEKVAWDKTKVDIASVSPGFKSLSDKDVIARMMDRNWAQDMVIKAREKADGFAEIARRSKEADKIRAATIQRERMLDLAESIEQSLSKQSTEKIGQGPKTRAAQRNAIELLR